MTLEAEYNNRARVPEHPQIIDCWQRDAAAWREASDCELDLVYGESDRSKLDLFHPTTGRHAAPVALFVHGGYWQALDRKFFSHMARGPNARGIAVAVASYDLCPDATVMDIVRQIRHACRWLWRRNGGIVTVYGHSAGGHLAAAMVATDWQAEDPALPAGLVPAALAISGLFDLEPLVETSINGALGLTAETAREASPLHWTPASGARLVAAVGGDESSEYLRQSRSVCEVWAARGAETLCDVIEGTNHFTVIAGLAEPASGLTETLCDLATGTGRPRQ